MELGMYSYFFLATAVVALVAPLLLIGRRPKGLPPGPPTVPILGNIHLMPDRDLHLGFKRWADEYGPIYSLILGTKTMVVLSSEKAIVDLLDKKGNIYSDRADHYLGNEILNGGNRLVMTRYGARLRMAHRVIHALLNKQKSTSYIPYQDLENKQMLFELLTTPDRFLDSVRRYAMSLTTSMVFDFRTVTFDDPRMAQLYELVDALTEIVQSASGQLLEVFPVLRALPDALFPMRRYAKGCHVKEKRLFRSLYLNVKENLDKSNPCFCVDMAKVQEKEGISDDLAAYIAGSVLEAGADTTSCTLYGFIQAMILFPEVQRKAQRYLDDVVGAERLPNVDDYSRLPYIRNCVKECTRWMPTAILGFPHAVMEDDTYMGYKIPKGATIVNNAWSIANDPLRHPDPRRFDPDRFKDSELNLVDAITSSDPAERPTFTFGAGRRVCKGMHVAENSLYLGIARILWAFDIKPAKDADGNDILPDSSKLTQGFVCMPERYEASITPRSPARAELIRKVWEEAQKDLDPISKQWR